MISKIGGIYQDPNSKGFLVGLQRRLKCDAELLPPPANIGRTRELTGKNARAAWIKFKKDGVDLVVRFTDADAVRWQNVQRQEIQTFPGESRSMLICGVAVENVEHWLALDPSYIASRLEIDVEAIQNRDERTGVIKHAIARLQKQTERDVSDLVADIVANAPSGVFRRWLKDDAFRRFYDECRAAANRHDCEVTDELGNN